MVKIDPDGAFTIPRIDERFTYFFALTPEFKLHAIIYKVDPAHPVKNPLWRGADGFRIDYDADHPETFTHTLSTLRVITIESAELPLDLHVRDAENVDTGALSIGISLDFVQRRNGNALSHSRWFDSTPITQNRVQIPAQEMIGRNVGASMIEIELETSVFPDGGGPLPGSRADRRAQVPLHASNRIPEHLLTPVRLRMDFRNE